MKNDNARFPNPVDAGWVKQRASDLGFTLVGISSPDPPPHHDIYRAWINAGRHAGMAYLARDDAIAKRAAPRLVFPECQSIIVTGTAYTGSPDTQGSGSGTRIASYALGDDYHRVLMERSRLLVAQIEQRLDQPIAHRIYTDTGPLLERELAQRSGLGWIGKNTCLINPRLGSYLLLAEILLDIPLQTDPPFTRDYCGSCTRCIEACPTQCILPDRTIQAGRCISYLTIEHKGTIRTDMRSTIGTWLFGCDICQQVCPWNLRFSKAVSDPAFKPRPFLRDVQLGDFLQLTPQEWRTSLHDSPLERPRRAGLVRNAAIVAGNLSSSEWISELNNVLQHDPEPLARAHAAWALGEIDDESARNALAVQLEKETDPSVRKEIKSAAGGL